MWGGGGGGELNGTNTQNDNFFIWSLICVDFSIEFLWTISFWKMPHRFVVAFTISEIWEDQPKQTNNQNLINNLIV